LAVKIMMQFVMQPGMVYQFGRVRARVDSRYIRTAPKRGMFANADHEACAVPSLKLGIDCNGVLTTGLF
jgi:hypothetical protein